MTPRYIFLDQNHWIYLAKAVWGKAHKPSHKSIPTMLLSQLERDTIRLPLGVIHLIEHLRDEQPDRRQRLAAVFERFSRGWFIASWADILPLEISRAIIKTFDPRHVLPEPTVFGRGFLFGVSADMRNTLPQGWAAENLEKLGWISAQPGALFDLLNYPNEPNRIHQKQQINELGYQYALAAENLRAIRKPYAKDMHRQAQFAGYMYGFQDQLRTALASIGRTLDDFIALGLDGLMQFWSQVPSLDVDCELTLYRDRQWPRKVQANDVRDIGHLALAIAYSDVVVVERFWARALEETGLAEKYQVTVCDDLTDLKTLLGD